MQRSPTTARRPRSCSSRTSSATTAASSPRPSAPTRWARARASTSTFVQDNHSRSRARHAARHALPDRARARPSSCAARAARSSTSSSTCAAARRPSASGRPTRSTTSRCASSSSRSASRTASASLSEVADVVYKCSSYYDAATEAASPTTTPTSASPGPPDVEPIVSERDATAPRLADVADALPFLSRGLSAGEGEAGSALRCRAIVRGA